MKSEDVDLLIEDLDRLVKLANTNKITISSWLSLANSATEIKKILEKQIPKTPTFENNGGCEYYEEWGECPRCGESIPEYVIENEAKCYCLNCGQKLNWENNHERM